MTFRPPRAVLLALAVALGPAAARAGDVTFHIRDRMAVVEVEELTTVYVDGKLVGSFRLTADDRDQTLTVSVDDAPTHDYALCGHVVVRDADGHTRREPLDVSGTLFDVAGRDFEAIASDSFTQFYLVDTTPDRSPARIEPAQRHACSPAVS